MKKGIALLLAALMLFGVLAGCSSKPAETTDTPQTSDNEPAQTTPDAQPSETTPDSTGDSESGKINYMRFETGLNETMSALKPFSQAGYGTTYCFLYSTLMKYRPDTGEYVPALADKVEVSEDGLVYTVTLGDHTFHDGTPITADDVVFSYNYEICAGGVRSSYVSSLVGFNEAQKLETETCEGIKKIDDKTVQFTLSKPNSLFMLGLSNCNFGILPASYFEGMSWTEINDYEEFWKRPVGSGAYMIDETQYPNYITLKAFEDYYDPASVKNVLMTVYSDEAASDAAIYAGQKDWIFGIQLESAENIMAACPDTYYQENYDCSYQRWFMINQSGKAGDTTSHPSLGNPRVRQAINMLLDKEAIATFYGEGAKVLTSHLNDTNPNYNSDLPTWKRDVEGAVAILQEENFDFDTPIRIFANYADQQTNDFLELVKQQLGEGGIQVTYVNDSNWQPYLASTDYDFRYAGGQQPADVNWYGAFISIAGLTDVTKGNYPLDNPEFVSHMTERYDDLVSAYQATQDPNEQKAILDQLQYNAYEDMIDIPLYSLSQCSLFSKRFSMPVLSNDFYEFADFQFSTWTLTE